MDWMSLVARLTLDKSDYESGLKDAEKSATSTGSRLSGGLKKLAGGVGTAMKVVGAGIAVGSAAVGVLTKKSVDAYSEYEQLAGGVKKLFGDASDDVMRFASEAYKTSGLNANQYMEQATSFSAALINSLGGNTKKAAEQADVAMRAMSDNVNTFGTDMSAVQYAFQGFAKANYTMLDNLKLGYGGTKTEMERLIADANEYAAANGKAADLSIESFSDIVTAIELIQEKQGIAGTTAKEAATTIEGAFTMTKAAWDNLVAGFANPDADIGKLMDNLVIAVVGDGNGTGLLNQLLPAIERALDGIGKFITQAAPIISAYLPGLMQKILPSLISAATSLVIGLINALPGLISLLVKQMPMVVAQIKSALIQNAPAMIESGKKLVQSIADGLSQAFPQIAPVLNGLGKIFSTAFSAIGKVIDLFVKHFETIKTVVVAVGGAIAAVGLVGIIGSIAGAIGTVVGAIGGLISALSMIKSFAGLVSVITTLAGGPLVLIPALIGAIVAAVIYLWNTSEGFRNFVLGLWAKIQEIVAGAVQVFQNLGAAFAAIWQDIVSTATAVWETLKSVVSAGVNAVKAVVTKVINAVKTFISKAWSAITQTISNAWNTIKSKVSAAVSAVKNTVSNVFNAIRNTVANIMSAVQSKISNAWNTAKTTVSNAVNGIKNGIKNGLNSAKSTVSNIFGSIKEKIKEKMDAAKEAVSNAIKKIKDKFNFHWSLPSLKLPHIKITGSWSLKPPFSFPHFSVDWYRKAMDDAFVLDGATIFGSAGGKLLGGGEAGREIIYGHDNLMKDIRNASGADVNARILSMLEQIYDLLEKGQTISIGRRDFARLVNEVS